MLNWYDLENLADTVTVELANAEITARQLEEAGVEPSDSSLRRMLAGAFIALGNKIDSEALATVRAA